MISFCIRRLAGLVPIGLGVVTLAALLAHVVPGDPADSILGAYATLEEKTALNKQLGLDQPVHIQILNYYKQVSRADLGQSLINQREVSELIAERFPATIELAIVSIIVAILIGVPLGILSAIFAGSLIDLGAMFIALIGVAMPNFWLGSMLILFFSIQLDWLPVSERAGWESYVLPSLTMGTALASVLSRMARNSMLDTLKEDYVRTARAKGVRESAVILKHVLKNAALPLVTIIGLQFSVILTGAVITEVIFDWPGIGSLVLEAVKTRDYPIIQGCLLIFSAIYLCVNLLTDIIYAWIDPRIKYKPS